MSFESSSPSHPSSLYPATGRRFHTSGLPAEKVSSSSSSTKSTGHEDAEQSAGLSRSTHTEGVEVEKEKIRRSPEPSTSANANDHTEGNGKGHEITMASDEDYAAFLEKANADPSAGAGKSKTQSSSGGKVQLKAVDQGVEVPASLRKATQDAFYVSDADEPFEPVALRFKGKTLPDEGLSLFFFFFLGPLPPY